MHCIPLDRIKVFDGLNVVWIAASDITTPEEFIFLCKQASSKMRKTDKEIKKLKRDLALADKI